MKKVLSVFIVSIGLIALAGDCPVNRGRLEEVAHNPSVVLVQFSNHVCSGFIIQKDIIVTAGHCVHAPGAQGIALFSDGRVAPLYSLYQVGSLNAAIHTPDFALLKTNTGSRPAFEISSIAPEEFDQIIQIGHPNGTYDQLLTRGIIVRSSSELLIAGTTIPGESGSPILDNTGKVIGVARGTYHPPTLAFATSIQFVTKALTVLGLRK